MPQDVKHIVITGLIVALCCGGAQAAMYDQRFGDDQASLRVTLDKTAVAFAESFRFSVELQSRTPLPADLTKLWQPSTNFFILDFQQSRPVQTAAGRWETRAEWRLESEQVGTQSLSAVIWPVGDEPRRK